MSMPGFPRRTGMDLYGATYLKEATCPERQYDASVCSQRDEFDYGVPPTITFRMLPSEYLGEQIDEAFDQQRLRCSLMRSRASSRVMP